MSGHRDETGAPCTRHAPASQESLLGFAAIGSRMSSFHHDVASKLQSLMMALEEITELGNEDVRAAAGTATTALQEINALLSVNRALTKAPQRRPTALRELLERASERHNVTLRGDVMDVKVNIALPSVAHALAMLIDMLAGALRGERSVAVEVSRKPESVALALMATTKFEPNSVMIDLAAFLLARENATLSCRADGFVVELPL